MRRAVSVLAIGVTTLSVLLVAGPPSPDGRPATHQAEAAEADSLTASRGARPNVVLILTDDMRAGDLAYMPKTRRLLGRRGAT